MVRSIVGEAELDPEHWEVPAEVALAAFAAVAAAAAFDVVSSSPVGLVVAEFGFQAAYYSCLDPDEERPQLIAIPASAYHRC